MIDRSEWVGPVLEAGDVAQSIVAAIRTLNEPVIVEDRGSYLRVLCRDQCLVTREAIERVLGRSFRLPGDLESLMPSFKGAFTVTEREAIWTLRRRT
jgi:hypothetical protein